MKVKILTFLILSVLTSTVYSQTCGFGCLGLSGVFGGYTNQLYSANGADDLTSQFRTDFGFPAKKIEFKKAEGFKIGANIFRADFTDYFFTAKAFYQFLKEEKSIFAELNNLPTEEKYTVNLNHWGIGLDFGIPVLSFVDFKVLEGGITFFKSSYQGEISEAGKQKDKIEFDNFKTDIGYYVGTGLIIHLIRDYVTVEGTAFYHQFEISKMIANRNLKEYLIYGSFIDKGGFGATVQMNFGIPLY